MEKVSKIAGEIIAIETPISETNLEKQPHKSDWVEIENEKHKLDLSPNKEFYYSSENFEKPTLTEIFNT